VRPKEFAFIGPQAEDFFTHYRASKCFISTYGFTFQDGLMEYSHDEVRVKHSMIAHSKQMIVLLDSSKIGVATLIPSVRPEDIDILVTDSNIKSADLERMRSMGIDIHVAKES